jgi:hypothetical protein
MVMATGIVSIAADSHGYWRVGIALSVLAVVAFAMLGLGLFGWAATHPARIVALARGPDIALRMFTSVAACAVLGVRWGEVFPLGCTLRRPWRPVPSCTCARWTPSRWCSSGSPAQCGSPSPSAVCAPRCVYPGIRGVDRGA